jgi:hypothetical protein
MNESRLREGSKVKVTSEYLLNKYPFLNAPSGIGYLITGTSYHKNRIADKDGDYWIRTISNVEICIGPARSFKVLEY